MDDEKKAADQYKVVISHEGRTHVAFFVYEDSMEEFVATIKNLCPDLQVQVMGPKPTEEEGRS